MAHVALESNQKLPLCLFNQRFTLTVPAPKEASDCKWLQQQSQQQQQQQQQQLERARAALHKERFGNGDDDGMQIDVVGGDDGHQSTQAQPKTVSHFSINTCDQRVLSMRGR